MKKSIFLVPLAAVSIFASSSGTNVINNIGNGASTAGAVGGLMLVYATAIVPVIMFVIAFGAIVGFYMMKFEQKDRGLWKTIGAIFAGLIVGYLLHYASYKVFDSFWGTGKSVQISRAFYKDIVVKALNPSQPFGTNIRNVIGR